MDGTVIQIKLPDGKELTIKIPKKQQPKPDGIYNYGCQLLEVGLLFKDLLDLTHMPERKRGLRLLKVAMLYFKSHNNLSKYAYEIMRFLVYQKRPLTKCFTVSLLTLAENTMVIFQQTGEWNTW